MNAWETPPPGLRSRDGELTTLRGWVTRCREGQDVVPHEVLPLAVRARRLREPVLEAWASLYGAGSAYRLSRYRLSRQLVSVSLTLFTRHDNRRGLAATRNMLSLLAEQRGDQAGAYTHLLEALRLAREVGEERYEGVVLGNLATLAEGGWGTSPRPWSGR